MRKLRQFCLLGVLLSDLSTAARAQTYTNSAGFVYTNSAGSVTITGYVGSGGALTIPDTISNLPVTTIGADSFYDNTNLTSVVISANVIDISSNAFENASLTNVTIPDSVTNIGDYAFYDTGLASVTIPASVTTIGAAPFGNCLSLPAITVASGNLFYTSANGVLCDINQTTLIQFPAGSMARSYTISNTVTSIGDYAFAICSSLAGITISDSVTNIGNSAFNQCYSLTSMAIPASVTSIGDSPFSVCSNLATITVDPNNPAYISVAGVLFDKNETTLITYPALKSGSAYTIPNGVTSIEDYAFAYEGKSLTTVTIPGSATNVGAYAFEYSSLVGIYFQGNTPAPTNDTSVFFGDANAIVYYYAGTSGWGATFDGLPTVELAAALAVITTSLPNGTNGAAYNQTLLASGGPTPYSWTSISGALPPGLTLATNGLISGTPSANGTFNFTVKVTDTLSNTATQELALTVIMASPLVAITTSLPNGTNGVAYNQTLLASGGQPPYSWTNIAGELPPGLTLSTNGLISGTPSIYGVFNFTVEVTDALSNTVTQPLSLTVVSSQPVTGNPPSGMALIPAGPFTIGDTLDGDVDAVPVANVYVSGFYMDTNVVSYSQWQAVHTWAITNGYSFENAGSNKAVNNPVQMVDWYDVVKWNNARSQQAGLTPVYYINEALTQVYTNGETDAIYANWTANGYRLPTEAEWEKAARGGVAGLRFPWGDTISESQANYYGDPVEADYDLGPVGFNSAFDTGAYPYTSSVGYFATNSYGLHDMAGNVYQWCWDWYGTPYAGGSNPHGPSSGMYRVARGGGWDGYAFTCRSANRSDGEPNEAEDDTGLRSVTTAPTNGVQPSITAGPQSQTVSAGITVNFGVTAAGAAPLVYQWFFGNDLIVGATNTFYSMTNVQPSNDGFYAVIVSNAFGVTEATATLTVELTNAPVPFTWTTNNNAITITGYIGTNPVVTIPSTINGYPVTSIGESAFYSNSVMASVTIPNSVTNLEGFAFDFCVNLTNVATGNGVTGIQIATFQYCFGLTSVTMGTNVTSIGENAFYSCLNLPIITIPNSVTSIASGAFESCTNLATVTIPAGVINIQGVVFNDCLNLAAITVDPQNPAYASANGVLFNKSQTVLLEFPGGFQGNYTIPMGVASIATFAFEYCTRLTGVTVPNSVTNFGEGAFESCISMRSITIGNNVTSFGEECFAYCFSLTTVDFMGNAPTADSTAFYSDSGVTAFYLPGTTGWSAFSTATGIPVSPWVLPNPIVLNNQPGFGLQSNVFGFTISWATNTSVVVQACTNLANPTWQSVATDSLSGGTFYFSDPQWTNYHNRFYRLIAP